MVDGKQRISTLLQFSLGQFLFKGKFFHELSNQDRNTIDDYQVGFAELPEKTTDKEVIEQFLRTNIEGTSQDSNHLEFVKSLYEKQK